MPQPYICETGIAAALLEDRIDTDLIFPARYLLLMERKGLGSYAFRDRRFTTAGEPLPDFVLNQPRYANAKFLLVGEDFGCGSSREQAVWCLADFGIRCVIAPSFGEIFFGNCSRSGVLPIRLPAETIRRLAGLCETEEFTVDLPAQVIRAGGEEIAFEIAPGLKEALLNGWDEVDVMLAHHAAEIAAFEDGQRQQQPWLYAGEER